MGAKQSNPLYPSRALRADPSADDTSDGPVCKSDFTGVLLLDLELTG